MNKVLGPFVGIYMECKVTSCLAHINPPQCNSPSTIFGVSRSHPPCMFGFAEAAKKRRLAEEEQELDLESLLTAPSDQNQPAKKSRRRRKKAEAVPSANGYAVGQKRRRKATGASFAASALCLEPDSHAYTDQAFTSPQTHSQKSGSLSTQTRVKRKRARSPVPREPCPPTCSSAKTTELHFKIKVFRSVT